MKFNQLAMHFIALMFCAWLPMTPIMAAAVEGAVYLADGGGVEQWVSVGEDRVLAGG